MGDVLGATLPFFALVGLGFWAARMRWVPVDSLAGLNAFVLYFALPCMLFEFGAKTPLSQLLNPVVVVVWLLSAAAVIAVAMQWGRWAGHPTREAAFVALVSTFPNSGFMGVPLLLGLLGAAAAGPTIATVLLDMVVTSSVCIALAFSGQAAASGGSWAAVKQALRGVAKNPMPWAVLAGAWVGAMDWAVPAPVGRVVALLAGAATPAALFCIGVVLWRSHRAQQARLLVRQSGSGAEEGKGAGGVKQGTDSAHAQTPVWGPVLLKLLLHPALVAFGLCVADWAGHAVPHGTWLALVLVAALPSAGNVSLLAERFVGPSAAVARITLWTTVWALLSFNAVVALIWQT